MQRIYVATLTAVAFFAFVLFLLVFALTPLKSVAAEGSYVVSWKDRFGKPGDSFTYKESHALLIGISDYTNGWNDLRYVETDLVRVQQVLEKRGFHVVVKKDLDQLQLVGAYEDFIFQYGLNPDARLVFYFTGHGHTLKPAYDPQGWRGVIVSRNAPPPSETAAGNQLFLKNVVALDQFTVWATSIQARHVLFVFDSCFSGGKTFALLVAQPADLTGELTERTSKPVRQFISAGAADQEVYDDGLFGRLFVSALEGEADYNKDGNVTGSELGSFLQKQMAYYRRPQVPQYGKIFDPRLDEGDIVFPLARPIVFCSAKPLPPGFHPTRMNTLDMEFVLMPAGEFQMGSRESAAMQPPHTVTLSQPFYLAKYETTQRQWMELMDSNPSSFTGDLALPVENVSWKDVQEFIRRLNAQEGENHYRLPTEAEWEYAARACLADAATEDADAQLDHSAWHDGNAGKRTHAVGQLKANNWGLYDMLGNVWEWCHDWYGNYSQNPEQDPPGQEQGAFRVYRGGGWYCGASSFCYRVDNRHGARPAFRHPSLGFRLVLTVQPESPS